MIKVQSFLLNWTDSVTAEPCDWLFQSGHTVAAVLLFSLSGSHLNSCRKSSRAFQGSGVVTESVVDQYVYM